MAIRAFRPSGEQLGNAQGPEMAADVTVGITPPNTVQIFFSTDSTRPSRFLVLIEPDSFKKMAQCMMAADASEAIKAFGAAMLDGVNKPSIK